MTRTYRITELAEEFGVTTRTIRFYEASGLLTPERDGNRRVYHRRDRTRLKLILRGKRLGFSLQEIGEMIDIYDADRSEVAQLRLVLGKIDERRRSLIRQRDDIDALLSELGALREQCGALLDEKEAPLPVSAAAG